MSRRAFLRATGITLAVAAAGGPALGALRRTQDGSGHPAVEAPDRIAEVAAGLGYDADAIFRFVADEIRYEPYPGVLRGAAGTLASRAGNSADQALLLAALLDASLVTYRFAVGAIGDPVAAAILERATTDVGGYRRQIIDALGQAGPGARRDPPPLGADQRARLAAEEPAAEAATAWAAEQLEATARMLEETLGESGVTLPGAFSPIPDRERREHVWLQVDHGNAWLDLDPTLVGQPAGEALASVASTLEALPDELAHHVELAVIVESLEGDALREVEHLRFVRRADALAGQPIMLTNVRPDGLAGIGIGVVDQLLGQEAWLAGLVAGDTFVLSDLPMSFAEADAASDGGLFGPSGGETTAQFLELTLRSPDGEPVVVRRTVFDRVDPEARAAGVIDRGALLPVEPVDGSMASDEGHIARASMWLAIATGGTDLASPVLALEPDDVLVPAITPAFHHLLTDAAGYDLLLPAGVHAFMDAPNVSGWSISAIAGTDETIAAADILHRSRGLLPVLGSPPVHDPALMAGVVAHVTERTQMLGNGPSDVDPELVGLSVGAIFDQALREGIDVRLLTEPVTDLGIPADADARLQAALADGWIAIVPERPVTVVGRERTGWWLIDPRTGRAVDMADDGRGTEVDYAIIMQQELNSIPRWARIATCVGFLSGSLGNYILNMLKDELTSPAGKQLMTTLMLANTATGVYVLISMGEACKFGSGPSTAW